jgi:hypothetical protein
MAEPTSRAEFKAYIFRRLGYPVLQINVADEQVEDRIDDALDFYQDYHYLGSEKSIYIHTVTADEVANKKITLPETIMTVSNVLPQGFSVGNSNNFMSDRWQFLANEFWALNYGISYSTIPYYVAMVRMAELDWLFNMSPSITFNKHKNEIVFTGDTSTFLVEGYKIALDTQSIIDPNVYADVWKDRWLKRYATALVKKQWAENLKLFSGAPLVGGMTLDWATLYQEAVDEIQTLEEKVISSYSYPILDEIA